MSCLQDLKTPDERARKDDRRRLFEAKVCQLADHAYRYELWEVEHYLSTLVRAYRDGDDLETVVPDW